MQLALAPESLAAIAARVAAANARFQQLYPGDSTGRQPVHTVYGGARLFKAGSAPRLGGLACGAITEAEALATGITLDELRGRSFVQIAANRTENVKRKT